MTAHQVRVTIPPNDSSSARGSTTRPSISVDTTIVALVESRTSWERAGDSLSPFIALAALILTYQITKLQLSAPKEERERARYRAMVMDRALRDLITFQDAATARLSSALEEIAALVAQDAPVSKVRGTVEIFSSGFRADLAKVSTPTLAALGASGRPDLAKRVRAALGDVEDINALVESQATNPARRVHITEALHSTIATVIALITEPC